MKSFSLLVVALWLGLAQSTAPPKLPPDPVYTQLRALKLSGETVSVTGLTFRRDAGTFTFKRGDFHFAEPVQGKVVAAVFIGEGEFRMEPPTEVEKHNLSLFVKQTTLTEPFSEVVLHFTDNTHDEIVRNSTAGKGRPNDRAASALSDRMELLRRGKNFTNENVAVAFLHYNLPARLLTDLYDPSHAGFFNAFIKGSKFEHLMFRVDPRGVPEMEPEEVVLAEFSDSDLGIWNSFHLAGHYGNAREADEDNRLFDIQHQEIDAGIKGTELRAKVRTTIDVRAAGPRVLRFDLYRTLRVTRVSDGTGQPLQFVQEKPEDDPDLIVILPKPLERGVHKLEFEYAGLGALLEQGAGNFALHPSARSNWYPSLTFGDRATYDMTLRIPKDLMMVASGQPQGSSQIGNELVTRWKSDVPLAVAGFNYGRFKKTELKNEKIKYVIESYANTNQIDVIREVRRLGAPGNYDTTRMMEKLTNEALVALGIYNNYFGPLPYGRVAMTQQPFANFGQSWPMLVYMPISSFFDSTTRDIWGWTAAKEFFRIVGPHEVAHQWWGHIVGWKSYRDQWMSEGFSELSASLFAHLVYGDEQFLDFWKDQRERILERNAEGRRPGDVASVTMGYRADNSRTGSVTRNVIYPKGGFILHMIRMMMYDNQTRDERFIAMMRDFVKTHYNQNISTEDFKRIVEKHMTRDMDITATNNMDWFFNQYVYGREIPRYKFDYQLATEGGETVLTMKLTQSEVSPNFRMAVPVYLETEDRKLAKLGVIRILGNSSQDAKLTLGFRPRRVRLAAYEDVLAVIDQR